MEEENKKEREGTSFSMQVKEELSSVFGSARHCQLAELLALILCCGRLTDAPNVVDEKQLKELAIEISKDAKEA